MEGFNSTLEFKGIIALDIDGTITIEKNRLEKIVNDYLNQLIDEKWRLIFITGRTFSFARPILSGLKGNYFFAVQNGAALFEMPSERLVKKHYLSTSLLPQLSAIYPLLVESGKEQKDICYYRRASFTSEELEYIDFRIQISPEKWISVDSFGTLKISEFAVGKYFATEEKAHQIAKKMRTIAPLNIIVIRDPFRPGYHLALVNNPNASKGHILEEFRQMHPSGLPAIAAGDDFNDLEMLEKSTFKIVMQNAPQKMHGLADLIAPPASEHGIIKALSEAIRYYARNN